MFYFIYGHYLNANDVYIELDGFLDCSKRTRCIDGFCGFNFKMIFFLNDV